MQVAVVLETSLALPGWTDTVTVFLLAICFPLALTLAWAAGLTPDKAEPKGGNGAVREGATVLGAVPVRVDHSKTDPARRKSTIAILPFQNASGDPQQDFVGEGLASDIISGLSRLSAFFVIARNSSFQYKGTSPDVRQVARELGVRYVLEGSFSRSGDRIRVSVQLVDGDTGHAFWTDKYDEKFADVLDVQDKVTQSIVGQLEPELTRAEYERLQRKRPEELGAWELYHQGWWHFLQQNPDSFGKARTLYRSAIKLDPNFAVTHAALAILNYSVVARSWTDDDEALIDESFEEGSRAVSLDANDPLAHIALGLAFPSAAKRIARSVNT